MAEKGFRLKLSGDGINVDRAVSAEVAQQIVAIALGTAPSVGQELGKQVAASVAQGLAAQASAGRGSPSVREFLLQQEAKRIPEQITTIALFLKNHRNSAVFTKKDLVKAFEDAQEPVPKNLPRDIGWTVRVGWIAPKAGMKDTYYITGSGETAAGAKFPADVRRKTKQATSGRRVRRRKAKKETAS
jgi:hypothetical protein